MKEIEYFRNKIMQGDCLENDKHVPLAYNINYE